MSTVFDIISGRNKKEITTIKKRFIELDEEDEDEEFEEKKEFIPKEKKVEVRKKEETINKVKIEKLVDRFIENHELVIEWEKWFDKQVKKGKSIEKLENSEEFEEFQECVNEANICFSRIKETMGISRITIDEILRGEIA